MALKLSEEKVLWFRAKRGHLAGPGAASPRDAVRTLVGAQSQQLVPSLIGISQRTKGRASAKALEEELFGSSPMLVRTWGQRGTLFVYDRDDWPVLIGAAQQWQHVGYLGEPPSPATLEKALAKIEKLGRPVTRTDLLGVAPKSYVKLQADRAELAGMSADRLATTRIIRALSTRGDLCHGDKMGTEQSYRRPAWAVKPGDPFESATAMARRYLQGYGPATPQDLAYFFNAKVPNARAWLDALDLIEVDCDGRKELVALAEDAGELRKKPPADAAKWPVRLLPLWDSLLMGHADKSWTTPVEAERKEVWRKAAHVVAVVLARGRIVAKWKHTVKRERLVVEVTPFSGWRKTQHASGVNREVTAVAAHLGLDEAELV